MKFEGTASIIAEIFADHVAVDTLELRGLRYQASRLLDENADDLFDIEFAGGGWKLSYLRNAEDGDAKAASALVRYAEARLAALEDAISRFATEPMSVSLAAVLMDAVPDSVRARIVDGSLEGSMENGRAATTLSALVRFVDRHALLSRPRALLPAIDR